MDTGEAMTILTEDEKREATIVFIEKWDDLYGQYKDCPQGFIDLMLSMVEWERSREKWLPIETAPKDGTQVLLYFPNRYQGKGGVSWGCFVDNSWLDSRAFRDNSATYWQPIPATPKYTQVSDKEKP